MTFIDCKAVPDRGPVQYLVQIPGVEACIRDGLKLKFVREKIFGL